MLFNYSTYKFLCDHDCFHLPVIHDIYNYTTLLSCLFFTALGLVGALDSDSGTESPKVETTELITIAQSILYASEYSNGKSNTG
jgi:hypothetical protein